MHDVSVDICGYGWSHFIPNSTFISVQFDLRKNAFYMLSLRKIGTNFLQFLVYANVFVSYLLFYCSIIGGLTEVRPVIPV